MSDFFYIIASMLFAACTLVVGVRNPIHAILLLILVFFLGNIFLFMLQLEYFAILFLIVYVGAIVVLFLFIVMMLDIKIANVAERFSDLFTFKNIILSVLLLEFLFFVNEELFNITSLTFSNTFENDIIFFKESNLYTDYSKLLQKTDHLRGLGNILYTDYKFTVIIAAFLLLLSMIGAIVVTLDTASLMTLKGQNATHQSLKNSNLVGNSFRSF